MVIPQDRPLVVPRVLTELAHRTKVSLHEGIFSKNIAYITEREKPDSSSLRHSPSGDMRCQSEGARTRNQRPL